MTIADVIASLVTLPRNRQAIGVCLALAITALTIQPTSAGTLSSVSPSGATPGITLTIVGTGFHVTAANDVVTFTPAAGAPLTAPAKTVATVDASTGLRRITVVVPDGLPVGPVALRVTNTATGEISQGASVELIALTVSGTTTGAPGSSAVQVAVHGSSNAQFVAGSTKVAFGAGVTLTALTIDSATLLHATLSIASTAALGPRALTVSTSTQTLGLLNAFTVSTTPPVNRAPTVNAGPNAAITLPAGASLTGSVTDDGLPTGAAVTSAWTKFSGPGTVAFANAASAATTATFGQAGTYVLRLTASDTLLSAFSDVTVTVNPAIVTPPTNLAPVVSAGTAQTITLPAGASLTGSVTDDGLPTGATVTSTWTKLSGPGNVAFANAASAATPATFGQAGTYVLRLTASDTLLTAFSDVTITVNPAIVTPPTNLAPVVSAGTAQTITLPAGASLTGSVTDDGLPTGATVTSIWTKLNGPGTVTFGNAASAATTATFGQAGTYVLRLTASDTLLTAFSDVTITVNPAVVTPPTNLAPVVSAGTTQTITLPAGASLNGSITDDGLPTGAAVTSAWTKFSGPGTVAFANAASAATTATFGQAGTYVLRLTASDTLLTAFSDVTVTVNPAIVTPPTNLAPVVSAGTAQTITLPAGASLTGSVTDDGLPTGAPVSSVWTKFSGPGTVSFANTASAVTTATFDQAGSYVLRLTASDTLLSAFSDVTITVNPVVVTPPTNLAPVVSAGATQTITLPAGASLNGSVTDDGLPTGAAVTSTWTKFSGPGTVAFANASSAVTTATFDQVGSYVLRLTASDTLLTAFSDVTVTVNPAIVTPPTNLAPVVSAGTAQTITLPAGASLTGSVADDGLPTGATVTNAWTKFSGPGNVAFANAASAVTTATFDQAGTYVLRLTASDTLLSAVGNVTITVNPSVVTPPTNHPPTAATDGPRTGETGVAVSFNGAGSTDPDNDVLTYAWTFGDGSTSTDQRPFHVYTAAGAFTVTLTVTDAHSASDVATTSATIAAAADRAPPIVVLTGPKEALPGAHVVMSADATDNIGVTSVTLDINGGDPIEIAAPPYQRLVIVPDFVAPGASLKVGATARDAAGNTGTASATLAIVAQPDTVKPLVTMKAPSHAAPGSLLQVSATASDNAGVAAVVLAVNGITLATLTVPPYEAPYLIPPGTPVGSSVTFSAQAVDTSDNRAISTADVSIVQSPDNTPPTVTLSAPATATAGTSITVTATAADDTGVASVRFFLDGTRVATVADSPYLATLALPATLPTGTRLHLEAHALDFSGLEGVASQEVNLVAPAAGVVTGEVYDDASGLPVGGASVALLGTDARGIPYTQTSESDAHGRYVMAAAEGTGVVRISKPGWSIVNRAIAIKRNKGVAVVDARITSAAAGGAIAALSGGIVSGDRVAFLQVWQREVSAAEDPAIGLPALGGADVLLRISPGALTSNAMVTLTPLSRQSLPGLLPPGWTPLAIVDIGPRGLAFGGGAALTSPNPLNVKAGTPVVFAQWDEPVRAWRAVASTVLAQDKGALAASVEATGQFAWVAADVVPASPPQPAPGELLAGVDAGLIPADASAVVNPQPKILFYKPGVKSDVRGTVTTAGALLPSGTIVRSRITESYQFVTTGEIHPDPMEQDLVLYQIPGGPLPVMAAGFPVSPGLTFEALSLDKGVITVELRAPEEAVHEIDVIGADGGSIDGESGQRLDVKAGSVPASLPIEVRSIPANALGAVLPAGFELVSAASISFVGTLASPATWSVPSPPGAGDTDTFFLARLQELAGQTRFVLIGIGTLAGGRLVSDTALAGSAVTFEGVRTAGRYAFLRATNPMAFAAGTVTSEGGAGFAGALITSSTAAIVSLSQSTGRYISAIALGSTTISALDLQKTDTVSAPVTASTPRQVIPLDLGLAARPPTVTSVTPADGAVNVTLAGPIVVTFSSPIDAATATLQNVRLTSSAGVVVGSLALTANNTVATFRALDPLQPNTAYTLTLSQAIADPFGRSLPSAFAATFTSLDTVAPLPPPAGSVTTTIPGADGKTHITATQGTAGSHDTALVKNLTTGKFTPVVLDANGGFTAIVAAVVTDRLQLIITDAAGNKTVVSLPRFRQENSDGTVSEAVGPEGGRLNGPGGIAIDVAEGTFPAGALLKFGPVSETEFPFHLDAAQRLLFQYSGGVRLDFGGTVPTRYVNVSVPTLGGETITDRWLVMQAVEVGGQSSLSAIDTAHVIDGRITTSSPPCPGVTGSGVYGFLKSARPLGVVYGPVTVTDRTLPPGVFIPFLVGPGLISFPMGFSDLLTPGIDGSFAFQDPLGLGNYISAAGETAAAFSRPPACLPLLSGRASLSHNRFTIATPLSQLTIADRELEVVNVPLARTTRFFRPFQPTMSIEGGNNDAIVVTAISASGNRRVLTTTRKARSYVHVLVASTELRADDREIAIKNLTGTGSFLSGLGASPGLPVLDLHALVEGEASDLYTVEITGAAGVKRNAVFGVLPYAYGNGSLLLRVSPGTIDPTLAEINVFNALVPPAQQLPVAGAVVKVVLQIDDATSSRQEIIADVLGGDTARLVGGSVNFAVNGTFDEKYALHVIYANGNTDEVKIPMFRVNFTNPSTGVVARTITVPVPPPDEPLFLDTSPPTGPTEVVSTPASLVDVDPRTPITVAFSRALDAASVNANLVVFGTDSVGNLVQVAGTWKLSQGNRVAKFIPAGALRLNATYQIALSGVSDLAGQPVAGTSLTVTTFRPRKIGTAALNEAPGGGALPLKDVGFVRQAGPGGEIATYAVAETANQNGFKVHTIDVTDPRTPLEMGHDAGGSYKRRMALIPDIKASANINVRYDVQLVPQQTGMSCWAAGAAMVVGWRDRQSVDPKSLIADHDYATGLYGADTVLFQHWGLVPEPPQTFSVASFRQMLEDYGPLWVSSAVPTTHIRVITGMVGDGTPDGTTVFVNDPWQQSMTSFVPSNKGETYAISYRTFQSQQDLLAREWFGDQAAIKQICDSGLAVACNALKDPFILQGLKDCSLGNNAACVSLGLPGNNGVMVAHLPQKPDWVPPLQTGQLTVRLPKPGEPPLSTCNAHVAAASGGRQVFSGDLAVTSSWNLGSNYFTFFDVTDASNPCVIGDKTITANPDQITTYTGPGTFRSQGSARGVTTIHHADGYAAYMAIAEAGLFAVDIGGSIPSVFNPKDRQQEGFYAGDFADVVAVRDRLLAVNNNYGGDASLEVLDPNLSPITSIPLTNGGATKQHRIVFNPGSWVDVNRNGRIDTGEIFDLAFVAGTGGVIVVDVTTVDAPTVAGRIQAPGILREIAVDASGKTIMAGGDRGSVAAPGGGAAVPVAGDALFMIDASNPFATPVVDATGRDSRIVFEYGYPDGIGGMSIDSQRSLVYVGWPASTSPIGALDIWASDRSARVAFNTPPIANAGPDATGDQSHPVTLDGSRSLDPDGDALTYAWTQVSGPPVALSDPTLAKPTFSAPPIDGAVLTFQLIVNDGVVDSPADSIVITVKAKGRLELRPVIAPIVVVPGNKQLTVTLTPGSGAGPKDVSADPGTTYRWIGNGLISGADGLPNITPILNTIATKLGVPIQLADISVNTAGMLTVNTPGLQVVRAHYKDADGELDSGFTVVLAGIKLKGIALKPESVLTTLAGTLSEAMGSDKNPPMILAAKGNDYVLERGIVLLDDVTFELLGTATISLKDLVSAIQPLVQEALTAALAETGPAAPVLAHAFTKLAGLGLAVAGVQALDPLVSGDPAIATISDTFPLQGLVKSLVPGLTSITGTLDLGALGKADDSVLVWVLPTVKSATVEPNLTLIRMTDPPSPGPTVRTFVEMDLLQQANVPLKGKAGTIAELLDRFLPDGLASWQTAIDKDVVTNTPFPGLRFHLRGSMTPSCAPPDASGVVDCSITFSNVGLGFYAPNHVPLVDNTYAVGDSSIVTLGSVETFDTHLVHHNKAGSSSLTGNFAIAFMGGAQDPTARVVVAGTGPVLTKTLDGDAMVQANDPINFTVTVTNPFETPLLNVQVTDTMYFTARGATSETVLQTTLLPAIPVLAPHQTVTIDASLTAFVAPAFAGVLRNEVAAVGSAPVSVTVIVLRDTLLLDPGLIAMANAPGTKQLTVTLAHEGGATEDVTHDAQTQYQWIGNTLPRALVDAIYQKINEALVAEGQSPMPAQLANVSINPLTGLLTVTTNGLQLLQATRAGLTSNPAVVLAGIHLKAIDLAPLSKLNAIQSALVTLDNPPMLLVADVPGNDGPLDKVGQVLLRDARFEILGGPATISAKKLVDALTSVVADAVTAFTIETGPLSKVFGWAAKLLVTGIVDEAGTQLLEPVTSTNPGVATVVNKAAASLPLNPVGRVDAHLSGLTDLKGTLDLGDYGKASDNVLAWVLPTLQSVVIEPAVTVINLNQVPLPDPKVRTFGTVSAGNASFALSGKFNDVAQAIDRFLPGGWTGSGAGAFNLSTGRVHVNVPVNDFAFTLAGSAAVTCAQPGAEESGCVVTVTSLTLGFQVPHVPGFISDTYVWDPSIVDTTLDANRFDTHIRGINAGRSALESHVDMTTLAMGAKDDLNGLALVFGGVPPPPPIPPPPPVPVIALEKRILGNIFALTPGEPVQFEILVANTTAGQVDDVTVTDTLLFNGAVVDTRTLAIGSIPQNEGRRLVIDVTTPAAAGVLENRLDITGCQSPCTKVVVPVRRPVINEVVVEPQRDWNDSGAGGNGTPFDDTPGASVAPAPAVTAGDQWIELLTNTGSPAELTNWTLEFTSTAGVPIVVTLGPANLTTSAGSPYVLVAAPGDVGVDSVIRLRDTTNAMVDEIDLSAIQAVVGHATGVNDEAVARTPDAFDTGAVTDFTRRPATIRKPNP